MDPGTLYQSRKEHLSLFSRFDSASLGLEIILEERPQLERDGGGISHFVGHRSSPVLWRALDG
jgi:hypothetical protein